MVHPGSIGTTQGADGMLNQASLAPSFSPRSLLLGADGSELETSTEIHVEVYPSPSPTRTNMKAPLRRSFILALDRERREAHEESKSRVLPDEVVEAAAAFVTFSDDSVGSGDLHYASPHARGSPLSSKQVRPNRSRILGVSLLPSDTQLDFKTLRRDEQTRPSVGTPMRPASAINKSTGQRGSVEESLVISEKHPASTSSANSFILHAPETDTGILTRFATLGLHDESKTSEDVKGPLTETSAFQQFPLLRRQQLRTRSHSDPMDSPSLRQSAAGVPSIYAAASILPPRPRHASSQQAFSSAATLTGRVPEIDLSPLELDVPSPPRLISSSHDQNGLSTPPQPTLHRSQSIPLLPALSTAEAEVKALSLPPSPSSEHVKRLLSPRASLL